MGRIERALLLLFVKGCLGMLHPPVEILDHHLDAGLLLEALELRGDGVSLIFGKVLKIDTDFGDVARGDDRTLYLRLDVMRIRQDGFWLQPIFMVDRGFSQRIAAYIAQLRQKRFDIVMRRHQVACRFSIAKALDEQSEKTLLVFC